MSIERCATCSCTIDTDFDEVYYVDDDPMCVDCHGVVDYDQAVEDWYNDPRRGQAAAINRENYKEPRE